MTYRCFDFRCQVCSHTFEDLVLWDETTQTQKEINPSCPECHKQNLTSNTERLLHQMGTAHQSQDNPVKQSEIQSKSKHMRLRLQGKLPWRKSSYSQSGNE